MKSTRPTWHNTSSARALDLSSCSCLALALLLELSGVNLDPRFYYHIRSENPCVKTCVDFHFSASILVPISDTNLRISEIRRMKQIVIIFENPPKIHAKSTRNPRRFSRMDFRTPKTHQSWHPKTGNPREIHAKSTRNPRKNPHRNWRQKDASKLPPKGRIHIKFKFWGYWKSWGLPWKLDINFGDASIYQINLGTIPAENKFWNWKHQKERLPEKICEFLGATEIEKKKLRQWFWNEHSECIFDCDHLPIKTRDKAPWQSVKSFWSPKFSELSCSLNWAEQANGASKNCRLVLLFYQGWLQKVWLQKTADWFCFFNRSGFKKLQIGSAFLTGLASYWPVANIRTNILQVDTNFLFWLFFISFL